MGYRVEYLADFPIYAQDVGHLKYEQWLHSSPDRPYETWIDEIARSARKDAFPMTLVLLQDVALLGFVTLIELDENAGVVNGLWLITLYVKAEYRRQGLGTALIARCIAEALRMGYGALYLWTEFPALTTYYERRGWRRIGQDEDGHDVMVYDDESSD